LPDDTGAAIVLIPHEVDRAADPPAFFEETTKGNAINAK
jgi:hypothetical protein